MLLKLKKYKNKDHPFPHHRKNKRKEKKNLISSYTSSTGLFCLILFGLVLMQGATLAAIFLTADVSSLPCSTYGCPKNGFNTLNEVVYNIVTVIIPKVVCWFKEPEQLVFFFFFSSILTSKDC